MIRKLVTGGVASLVLFASVGGVASADHLHSKQVGNGSCVVLAQHGGENLVVLPEQNPHITGQDENRRHPLHVMVHLGQPGQHFAIGVYPSGNDPCDGGGTYLNVH